MAATERTRKVCPSSRTRYEEARDCMGAVERAQCPIRPKPLPSMKLGVQREAPRRGQLSSRGCPAGTATSMRSVRPRRAISTVIMNASKALDPSAHRTIQMMSPTVVATMTPMGRAQRLAQAPRARSRRRRARTARGRVVGLRPPRAPGGCRRSRRRRPRPRPRGVLGRGDAEARARPARRVCALARATIARERVGQRAALAGRAGDRDRVEEAARRAPIAPRRSSGVVGATSGTSATPARVARREHLAGLLERQVGDDQPARARRRPARRASARRPARARGSRST